LVLFFLVSSGKKQVEQVDGVDLDGARLLPGAKLLPGWAFSHFERLQVVGTNGNEVVRTINFHKEATGSSVEFIAETNFSIEGLVAKAN